MTKLMNTLIAGFAALWTMNLTAYAAEATAHTEAMDTTAILENIYAEMDKTQDRAALLVFASAETRMEARIDDARPLPMHRPLINTFAQAHLAP